MNILLSVAVTLADPPWQKVIFEQLHSKEIATGKISTDSAAYDTPSGPEASMGARNAIKNLYGQDLLQGHRPKKCNQEITEWANVIVVMTGRMKNGMPPAKTKTLKEYAGETGDISDPYMQSDVVYLQCANEIKRLIEIAW